jgi:nucleolar protein 56
MKVYIVTNLFGIFAIENNKLIAYKLFEKNPETISKKILTAQNNLIDEEKQLIDELSKKGYREFVFSFKKEIEDRRIKFEPNNIAEKYLRKNLRSIIKKLRVFKTETETNEFLTKVGIAYTREKIKKTVKRDVLIVQAINALDEITKSINILSERLREFYGFHFPELDELIKDHKKFAKIVSEFGYRQNIKEKELQEYVKKSVGIDIAEEDIKTLQEFAKEILELYKLRERIEKYIDKTLKEIAPNLREVAGSLLAARLIAEAGSLDKLAKLPSSTIQLLGAEKALFRFLHGRGKSPKYGRIYLHPLIQKAPRKKQGMVARNLASKLSIAAKMDRYGKQFIGDKLREELEEKFKEIVSK